MGVSFCAAVCAAAWAAAEGFFVVWPALALLPDEELPLPVLPELLPFEDPEVLPEFFPEFFPEVFPELLLLLLFEPLLWLLPELPPALLLPLESPLPE